MMRLSLCIGASLALMLALGSVAHAQDISALLPKADAAAGKAKTQQCAMCHSFDKGGTSKIGPNLWGVVDRPIASAPGYTYSSAMQGMKGKTWTVENLDTYLNAPTSFVKGNKMAFAGVKNPQDRANIIAWLRSLSDKPVK